MKNWQQVSVIIAVIFSFQFGVAEETAKVEEKVQVEEVVIEEKPVVDEMMDNGELTEVSEEESAYEKFKKKYNKAATSQQPTTVVEAAPLEESRAEQLRRERQDAEIGTERKIVEKLEASRLEDEKRRAEKLFGGNLDSLSSNEKSNQQGQEAAQPVTPPAPQQVPVVVVPSSSEQDNEEMKEELISAVRAELRAQEEVEEVVEDRFYVSATIGSSEYPNAPDVKSNSSVGVLVGSSSGDNVTVEGGFLFSSYFLDQNYYSYKEITQYNFTVGVKYSFLTGRVKPQVGALASYTTRKYQEIYDRVTYIQEFKNEDTSAFDVGVGAGVDLMVSDSFGVGVDLKYFTNVTTRSSDNFKKFVPNYKVEDYDYYVFNLLGKIYF